MSTELVALGRFNELARFGARKTANALEQLTGQPARAPMTDVRLTRRETLDQRFACEEYVGVHVAFSGHVDGTAVIAMPERDVSAVASALGAEGDLVESGLESVGNLAASGFVDVIANSSGTSIELEPPYVVDRDEESLLPLADGVEWVVTITSEFELLECVLDLDVVLLPDTDSLMGALEPTGGRTAIDRLIAIGELTREGASNAAGHVSMMTGLDANVSVSRVRFAPVEAMVEAADADLAVGTVFELRETPNGYFALLFDEPAAKRVADAMVPDGIGDNPDWEGMGKSAISELGNIVTSGFIDGWADAMGGTIAHSPPAFVADDRRAIVSSLVADLAAAEVAGVIVDAEVSLDEGSVACTLHTLPTRDGLEVALERIEDLPTHG